MRALGHQVVDLLVAHFAGLEEKPVAKIGHPDALAALIAPALPEAPTPPVDVLKVAATDVLGHIMHTQHPRFMAYVPSPSNFMSVMADALVAGFNPFAGTWMEASGPAMIERRMIEWLRTICGLPDTAGGLFTSGGSMANLTALVVARRVKLGEHFSDGVVYMSDQTHSSVLRGLMVIGLRADQLRVLPCDDAYCLAPGRLREAIEKDRRAAKKPFCVVANAGTTNTGAVDPLAEIAEICAQEQLWLHVDGAYGAAAALVEDVEPLFNGLGEADSIVIDPHKWLFQPYEIGCVLLRDRTLLRDTFRILPEYLQDLQGSEEEINFCDYGIQLTRSFRALKLWMSVQTFGLAAFRKAVRRGIELAEEAERRVRRSPSLEIVTPAQIGILTFRYAPRGAPEGELDQTNRLIVEELKKDGRAFVSSTRLNDHTVLRICAINPRSTGADLQEALDRVVQIGNALRQRPPS